MYNEPASQSARGSRSAEADRARPGEGGDRERTQPSFAEPDESATLKGALNRLVLLIEQQLPAMRGSILLLDDDGVTLHHGAAPHLPVEYCRSIDGSRIGPTAGSCGTAAYRAEQVIVQDIATDPLWKDYKALALPHGLRACWSTPILDAQRKVLGTFAMYYDEPREPTVEELALTSTATLLAGNIVVRGRAEAALRVSEDELRRRTEAAERAARALVESEAEMRTARAEAERANKAKSDFLAMMSHELRTPLNAIGGYATLMLDGIPTAPSDGQQNYLRRIAKAQQHLLGLIDAVLTHAKLEAGRMTYRLVNVRMGELLDAIESLVTPQLAAKQIAYDCTGCDSRLVLRVDRQKTVQILLNLLSNAVKFTPANGLVTIRTAVPTTEYVAIGVRDTGVGMTDGQAAAVFEPYVQFDNELTRQERGTGLGMPISRDLARGMRGELTVQSALGVGTEFLLTLPLAPADAQQS
jgi:two-component system cell cycle sensor histidine kinase PleC